MRTTQIVFGMLLGLLMGAGQAAALMPDLKASTAATVLVGPFVDDIDGKTAETALSIAQADVKLSKNGGALGQKADTAACTHSGSGYYACALNSTDTNTAGTLTLTVSVAGALPVRHDYRVLRAAVFDTQFATGSMPSDVDRWNGTAVPAPDTAGYPKVTIKDGTGTGEIDTAAGGVALKVGAITDGSYELPMTISAESSNSVTDVDGSPDPITADGQWNAGYLISFYDATTQAYKTSACITNSTAATNVFATREDVSSITTVGDKYQITKSPACQALRPATAERTLVVSAGGAADAQVKGMDSGVVTAAAVATGANTPVMIAGSTTCDISAATSATVWSITGCQSPTGESVTLSSNMFEGRLVTAYTNGASACNVVGQASYIDDQTTTAGTGAVTAKTVIGATATPVFSGTPSTTNCGIRIY